MVPPSPTPRQSAWEYLFGPYNINATHMGPAGCHIIIHVRRSWDFCCRDGYYIGPALNHYHCYKSINKASGATIISDPIKFHHHYLPSPTLPLEDKLLHAFQANSSTVLRTTHQPANDQLATIQALWKILHHDKQLVAPPGVGPPPGVHPLTLPGAQLPTTNVPLHTPFPLPSTYDGWMTVPLQQCSFQRHEHSTELSITMHT